MSVVAVTGATGFLGGYLVEHFRSAGHEVVGVVREPSRAAGLGVRLAKADLADLDALTAALQGVEVLIANAALAPGRDRPSQEAYTTANLTGAHHHLEAAERAGVRRIVWISTVAVYQTRLWRAMSEKARLRDPDAWFDWNSLTTDPAYSRSKALAERMVWAHAARTSTELVVLRPGPIIGAGDGKLTARYRASLDRPHVFAPTVGAPHVHAADVARVAVAAAETPLTGRAYNVTGRTVSPYRLLRTWGRLLGRPCRVIPVPIPLAVRFDDGATHRDLGFEPMGLEAMLAAC